MINFLSKKRFLPPLLNSTFSERGVRNVPYRCGRRTINRLRKEWKEFVAQIKPYPQHFRGRGIVICAGGVGYLTCAWVNITTLRKLNCTLPIELWYNGEEEMIDEITAELQTLDVVCKNLKEYTKQSFSGYAIKPLAILFSAFKEVLYLDADNNCTANPTYLFDATEYKQYGAIFWPDYWKTSQKNPIWKIVDNSDYETFEQESGQLLLNKETCWKALQLCSYFNMNRDTYYKMVYGDKDTFKFAWLALKVPFYMIRTEVGTCGFCDGDRFHGVTMVQHDVEGNVIFLHRNLLKWDVTKDQESVWKEIRYVESNEDKRILLRFNRERGHDSLDLQGDITQRRFIDLFGTYEQTCLKILQDVRASDPYRQLLLSSYFNGHRRIVRPIPQ